MVGGESEKESLARYPAGAVKCDRSLAFMGKRRHNRDGSHDDDCCESSEGTR
jgi:hypothetical protein